MHQVLGHFPYVEIYLDDITVHSATFDEHIFHLRTVFVALANANLKVNAEKCTWFSRKIKLLGHVISKNHIAMDPAKIEAIKSRIPPTNVKQVQQYLGICNYYRRFIQDFSKIASPLFQLLQKDKKWEWTSEHQCAFDALKDKLVSYPILRHPVRNRTFWLHTDASGYALGAVLSQKDPEDDKEYVVAYASRMLKGAELHYGITEKECLAVVYAVKLFRIYLYGAKFNIVTDHSALNWLMSIKDPTGRLARWSIYLQAFNFEISHKKGTLHTNVDTLSRPVVPKILAAEIMNSGINVDEPSSKILDPYDDEGLLHYLRYARHMNGASAKQVRRIENLKDHFSLTKEGLLYRKNVDSMNYLKVPQKEERNDLIIEAHNLGHFQTASTLARLKERYFWKNMETDVEKAVSRCLTCQRHERVPALYHPALAMEVAGCFDEISIDCSWGFPTTKEGFHGVMTIKARMTRFPFAYLKSEKYL
jgi:hypothetical protein